LSATPPGLAGRLPDPIPPGLTPEHHCPGWLPPSLRAGWFRSRSRQAPPRSPSWLAGSLKLWAGWLAPATSPPAGWSGFYPPSLLSPPGDTGRRRHGSNLRHAVLRLSPGRPRPISSAGRRLAALSLSAWRDGFVANRREPLEVLGEGLDTDPGRKCVSRHSSSLAYPQP
jgi:hypothetical protein